MPLFERAGAEYVPVVQSDGKDGAPVLCGAIYQVDALKAYSRAMAATAAEEHS